MESVYLDNAATTPLDPRVIAVMRACFETVYGNPSSLHGRGRDARAAMDTARNHVAELVGAKRSQIVFTSSGTEAIQQVFLGSFLANPERKHIVTTAIEHHAVLHACELLEELGVEVTYVPADRDCNVDPASILAAVRPNTLLVSVMAVNNETGTVQPVKELAEQMKAQYPDVLFHSDMVQALPVQKVNLSGTHIDFASFSAHKIHGPKGIGAFYLRSDKGWKPILRGGNQERKRRGGTENVAGIVGFGEAARLLKQDIIVHQKHIEQVYQAFWKGISELPGVYRNSPEAGVKSILNIGFHRIPNDVLLMRLDLAGVEASAGSACTAGSLQPSHVLAACGYSDDVLRESIRVSFSAMTSLEDVRSATEVIRTVVKELL